jgi:hypothetical protein
MTHDILWLIWLFEVFHLFVSQCLALNLQSFVNSLNLAKPNDTNITLLNGPCHCDMTHLPSLLVCQFLDAVGDGFVRIIELGEVWTALLVLGSGSGPVASSGRAR